MHISATLHDRRQHHFRAAKNLLESKGNARWTLTEQSVFDLHANEVERINDQIETADARSRRIAALKEPQEAFELFLRKGIDQMSASERTKVRNTMSTTTGSQGGYTLAPVVASDLVNLIKGAGWMRATASEITTDGGADMVVPTSDGTSEVGELLAQSGASSSLDPSFGSAPIATYRFGSKVFTVPIELLQDSQVDIVAFIQARMMDRIARAQNPYFTTGTGTAQPFGLFTAASVGKIGTTGQTATILCADLVDLAESVDQAQLGIPTKSSGAVPPGVGWMMSQAMRKVVRKLTDTNGRPIWMPGISNGTTVAPAMLLDFPAYINNDAPAPAANAKSLAFGNLSSYMIRDAMDVTMFRFEDSAYAKFGQVGFLGIARAGGNLLDSGAVKAYQHSAT